MVRKKMSKKIVVSLLTTTAMMAMLATSAMAATDYPMVTLQDSADFTVVKGVSQSEAMQVQGLDGSYVKHDLGADETYVTWTTSNPSVAKFVSGLSTVNSITGNDNATVRTMGEGTAVVTATYDSPTADPVTVTSYVVVEGSTTTSSVAGIDVAVDFTADAKDVDNNDIDDFTLTDLTVPLFDISAAGITANDDDVLAKTPTALHAYLYALEVQFSSETTSTPISSFNWDWVIDNVDISSEGSYLGAVGTDDGNMDWANGWQFKVNNVDPGHAASVTPLSTNANVTWGFLPW